MVEKDCLPAKERENRILPVIVLSIFCSPRLHLNIDFPYSFLLGFLSVTYIFSIFFSSTSCHYSFLRFFLLSFLSIHILSISTFLPSLFTLFHSFYSAFSLSSLFLPCRQTSLLRSCFVASCTVSTSGTLATTIFQTSEYFWRM